MKVHTTNYFDSFIHVSADCGAAAGTVPPKPDSVAGLQYRLIHDAPHTMTSDDLLVAVTAARRDVPADEQDALRAEIFSKGQPCLRASPLVKTYGWGVHHDAQGRIALVGRETAEYAAHAGDPALAQVPGMRSRRA